MRWAHMKNGVTSYGSSTFSTLRYSFHLYFQYQTVEFQMGPLTLSKPIIGVRSLYFMSPTINHLYTHCLSHNLRHRHSCMHHRPIHVKTHKNVAHPQQTFTPPYPRGSHSKLPLNLTMVKYPLF